MPDLSPPPEPTAADSNPSADTSGTTTPPRLLAATLVCENCGRSNVHRILRWDPGSFPRGRRVSGIARCRECEWTHPFEMTRPVECEVDQIVSKGSVSSRERIRLPALAKLAVGGSVPGADRPLRIRRIDVRSGDPARTALAREVTTLWATLDEDPSVAVSIVEGARTRTTRWSVGPDVVLGVGDEVRIDGSTIEIVALRAIGHTWRRAGDRFRAVEVQRLYGRRTVSPPAGRSDWSRGRGRPSSRTSSFSRSSRSRSGPGVSTTRRAPRARMASGGAILHSWSPS